MADRDQIRTCGAADWVAGVGGWNFIGCFNFSRGVHGRDNGGLRSGRVRGKIFRLILRVRKEIKGFYKLY